MAGQSAVQHYCVNRNEHKYKTIEYLVDLSFDDRNRLISEKTLSKGSVDQAAVYLHGGTNVALKHHEQAVIFVHNHPSGETTPSSADIKMTDELQRGLGLMTIDLHDHLIVAGTLCISLKSLVRITRLCMSEFIWCGSAASTIFSVLINTSQRLRFHPVVASCS